MKSLVIATMLATTAFAASAMSGNGEIYGHDKAAATSMTEASKTRAEVVAELREAQNAGTLAYGEFSSRRGSRVLSAGTALTRAEVRMEISELGKNGSWSNQGSSNAAIYRN